MAPHKEYQFCVLHIGSTITRAQIYPTHVLHESLPSEAVHIPTKIYKTSNGLFTTKSTDDDNDTNTEVDLVTNGIVKDTNAFNYFVKLVVNSLINYNAVQNQNIPPPGFLNIHLVVITTSSIFSNFSKSQLQKSYNYLYDNLSPLTSVTFMSNSMSLLFAYGAYSTNSAVVVDVGYEKSSVAVISDYLSINFASVVLPVGGNSINKRLQQLLPELSESQIEDLKKSTVYEVLAEANKNSNNTDAADDEIDVMKIVTSSKPKEALEKRAKKKDSGPKENLKNFDKEFNTFIDSSGEEVQVGKQRFLGSEELIDNLSFAIEYAISKYPDNAKRQELWSSIILNGPTSGITGFKEYLLETLQKRYLAVPEKGNKNDVESKFRATGESESAAVYNQAPNNIAYLKKAEYFPDWKDYSNVNGINNDLTILGAVIYVRLCFGPGSHHAVINNIGNELYMMRRDDFEEQGPNMIWDLSH